MNTLKPKITITIDPKLLNEVDQYAKENEFTRSLAVAQLLKQAFKNIKTADAFTEVLEVLKSQAR